MGTGATAGRLTALRGRLALLGAELDAGALLINSNVNRRYLSGFTGSAGYLLLTEHKSWLITDFRYTEQAQAQAEGWEVVEHGPEPLATIRELAGSVGVQRIGFEQHKVTYGEYTSWSQQLKPFELVPTTGLVEALRMHKDAQELAIMQEAATLADQAFAHILAYVRPGVAERELALELEMFMRRHGATSSSFDTIVASGPRSALPHGVASERLLQPNELITFDFGAYYKGYCSDLTRTVVLGKASERHREIYGIVLEAQLHALAQLRPGMTGKEADALTRTIISRYGYGERFGHGTGHGLGMEIHEEPRLSMRSDTVLTAGMTVTVEPGIYLPGFGGVRIEDDVALTEDGIIRLTSAPKELLELG